MTLKILRSFQNLPKGIFVLVIAGVVIDDERYDVMSTMGVNSRWSKVNTAHSRRW